MDDEYELSYSFNIDGGELYGLSQEKCFVLGFELGMIHSKADEYKQGENIIFHWENGERIEDLLKMKNREYELTDMGEGWGHIQIAK